MAELPNDPPIPTKASPRDSTLEKGFFFAAVTLLIWSSFHLISRIAGTSALNIFDVAALRIGVSAIALSPWWLPRLFDKSKRRADPWKLLGLSLLTGITYPLISYLGYRYAPASHGAVIIVGLLPPFTALFAYKLMGEKPNRLRVVSISCVIAGVVAMLISSMARTGLDLEIATGDLIFALASLIWAAFTVLLHKWKMNPFDVTVGMAAISALIYIPIYVFLLPKSMAEASTAQIALQAIFQGLFVPCVATFTYAKAIEYLGATRTVMMLSATPVMGTLLGVGVLGEKLYPFAALGVFIVFVGSIIGVSAQRQPNRRD